MGGKMGLESAEGGQRRATKSIVCQRHFCMPSRADDLAHFPPTAHRAPLFRPLGDSKPLDAAAF